VECAGIGIWSHGISAPYMRSTVAASALDEVMSAFCFSAFDTVSWMTGRASGHNKPTPLISKGSLPE